MEKLIELLNERETGEEGGEMYYISNGVIRDDGGNILYDYRITSKEFGFIKRLVENDKIDYLQLAEDNTWNILKENGGDNKTALLMLLSISDTPIEFLCSILKDE